MTDIHSHIIPFVDDGSEDINQSIQMIKSAAENGVNNIVCTPHYRKPFTRSVSSIKRYFEELKKAVKEAKIPINLYLGQEIYVDDETDESELIRNGTVLTVNDTDAVLIEFDFTIPCNAEEIVYRIKRAGYTPIIAHVERYKYLSLEDVYGIKRCGGFIQVNASSLFGKPNGGNKRFVYKLFKEGFVDFVASDVHFGRENYLGKAYKKVKKKFGLDAAEVTFNENAKVLLKIKG